MLRASIALDIFTYLVIIHELESIPIDPKAISVEKKVNESFLLPCQYVVSSHSNKLRSNHHDQDTIILQATKKGSTQLPSRRPKPTTAGHGIK